MPNGRTDGCKSSDYIVCDLHEVIVSMCTRLCGKRSGKNRAQKAIDAIHAHDAGA